MYRLTIVAVVLVILCVRLLAGEPPESSDSSGAKQWIAQRSEKLAEYHFQLRQSGEPLEFERRCLLSWSNPERAAAHGGVFVWTHNGRPQLLACAFTNGQKVNHEFQSLSGKEIVAELGDREVHRFTAGPEWKNLPDSPPPEMKRSQRLSQFRRQAQRFTVRFGAKDQWSEARQLTQPVFVSQDGTAALFMFVQGTDPECALQLEVTAENKWRYILARQTKWGLRVQLDGKDLWNRIPDWEMDGKGDDSFVVLDETVDDG